MDWLLHSQLCIPFSWVDSHFIHSFTGLIFHPSLHADLLIYVSTHRYTNHGLIHFLTQLLVSAFSICSWHNPWLPFMTSFLPLESFSHSLVYPFILFIIIYLPTHPVNISCAPGTEVKLWGTSQHSNATSHKASKSWNWAESSASLDHTYTCAVALWVSLHCLIP